MTWTWNDDDPATSASAQNFNTHIENRLRALEAGGGGGDPVDTTLTPLSLKAGMVTETLYSDPDTPSYYVDRGRVFFQGTLGKPATVDGSRGYLTMPPGLRPRANTNCEQPLLVYNYTSGALEMVYASLVSADGILYIYTAAYADLTQADRYSMNLCSINYLIEEA